MTKNNNVQTILHDGIFVVIACLALGATIPAAAQSDVTIEKATNGVDADAPPGPTLIVGDPVNWTYEVTASGSRDLFNIVVTDDQGVTVACPDTTLGAGASMVCTASGTVVANQYANIGTVDAEFSNATPVTDSDPSHYFGVEEIAITLEKTTEGFDADTPPGPVLPVNSLVTWTYLVQNIGMNTLSDITVSDDQGVTVSCPGTTLSPGESMTCTASGTVAPGQYMNLGIVMAELPDTTTVSATDPSHYFGQLLLLEKATNGEDADAPPGPWVFPGDPVTWTYEVSNPGPETVTSLNVTDDQGEIVSCPVTILAAGESTVCAANGTALSGQYANIGTATAELPLGGVVSGSDPSHYLGQGVGLEKRTNGIDADDPPGAALPVGSAVNWTYEVINAFPEDLSNIVVTDSEGETVTCPATTLLAGESMTCTATGMATTGQYMNLGAVTAVLPDATVVDDDDPSHYFGQGLLIEKATNGEDADVPPGPTIAPGDAVAWTYEVTNPGPAMVTNLAVTDDQGEIVTCPVTTLADGESTVCSASGVAVAGQYANIGTATAELPLGGVVTVSDPSHYLSGTVNLEKHTNGIDADNPPGPALPVGDSVEWTYEVTNDFTEALSSIEVTDDQGETVTCPETTLAAGESMTCTASGVVVAGQYANIGTVAGELPFGDVVTGSDPSHYFGSSLDFETRADGDDANIPPGQILPVGSTVELTYEISNGLLDPLTNIEVTDSEGVTVSCPETTLAPGEIMVCTGSTTVTAGQSMHVGTITAELPDSTVITATNATHYFGQHLTLVKATNDETADQPPGPTIEPGQSVTWTYQVTNPGPETVSGLAVIDDQEGVVTCPVTTLAAGESTTCTADGIARLGQYTNLGTATATLPLGGEVSATDRSHYTGQLIHGVPTVKFWGLLLIFILLLGFAWRQLRPERQAL